MHIGSEQPVVVCEGFKAAMWVTLGCPQVDTVALLGTDLSAEHELLLTRVANDLILFLENDEPGREAMRKIAERLGGSVRIANYNKRIGASPDDLNEEEVRMEIESDQTKTRIKYERRSNR